LSVQTPSPSTADTLEAVIRQAGGVLASHQGLPVAVNFGSAAGELAACVSAVGLTDFSDLTKLVLEAPHEQMRRMVPQLAGAEVAPGGALFTGGAWWCGASTERLIVLCGPQQGNRLSRQLRARAVRVPGLRVQDRTADWAAIATVGHRTRSVLRELGVYGESGDPRRVQPLTTHSVAGAGALWLLESDYRAVALVPRASAAAVWRAIERAGRQSGICAVGRDAVTRYALMRRTHP
jgi:glycine cleavage system aminomethyltransferase T